MKNDIITAIQSTPARSAWQRGVKAYALELLECLEVAVTNENLLNGAADWTKYSFGGASLIYNWEIAERLCSPSELRRIKIGELTPSGTETWLDCQGRALYQASSMILREASKLAIA